MWRKSSTYLCVHIGVGGFGEIANVYAAVLWADHTYGIPVTTPAGKCAPDINNASGNRSTRALITAELHPWTGLRRGTPRNGESYAGGMMGRFLKAL